MLSFRQDIEGVDPSYFKTLQWMLENDITDVLDLNFTEEVDYFGRMEVKELKPGGKDVKVCPSVFALPRKKAMDLAPFLCIDRLPMLVHLICSTRNASARIWFSSSALQCKNGYSVFAQSMQVCLRIAEAEGLCINSWALLSVDGVDESQTGHTACQAQNAERSMQEEECCFR